MSLIERIIIEQKPIGFDVTIFAKGSKELGILKVADQQDGEVIAQRLIGPDQTMSVTSGMVWGRAFVEYVAKVAP